MLNAGVMALAAGLVAQVAKVVVELAAHRRWRPGLVFDNGGMPSSHTATVTALTMAVHRTEGWDTSVFSLVLVFSLFVIFEATGLRQEIGQQAQVLIGTQMISKGHHFPAVALAAVLLADTYLAFPDFRAVERSYSLLTQLAGRAGRGERPGKVLNQTFHPDHYAIRAALNHDDAGFAAEEMRFRKLFHYPPYTRMVQLMVQDKNRDRAAATAERLAHELGRRAADGVRSEREAGAAPAVRIMGPAPAAFERLRGKWRFQILVRGRSGRRLRQLVRRFKQRS